MGFSSKNVQKCWLIRFSSKTFTHK